PRQGDGTLRAAGKKPLPARLRTGPQPCQGRDDIPWRTAGTVARRSGPDRGDDLSRVEGGVTNETLQERRRPVAAQAEDQDRTARRRGGARRARRSRLGRKGGGAR